MKTMETQKSPGGRKKCNHLRTNNLKYTIDIMRSTVEIVPHEDSSKYCIKFTYKTHVPGSITLHLSETDICYDKSSTTTVLKSVPVDVTEGLGYYIQEEGFELPFYKVGLTEIYHLEIKTISNLGHCRPISIKGQSSQRSIRWQSSQRSI